MRITNNIHYKSPIKNENNVKKTDFKKFLIDSIEKINNYENEAKKMGLLLATGQIDNVHDVIIAGQKAEIALQFGIEVKNKIMDAYEEIMRIQI